ncbi:MAG: GTP-binding protein [Desulfatiglandales bacterium]
MFFDFLPFNMGKIAGYDTVIQLYTVPGQAKYEATRRLVLRGVDGIVFVADSLKEREEDNILFLKGLEENLKIYKKDIREVPIVFQYNKRDLAALGFELLPVSVLQEELNRELKAPAFEASALKGINVINTLKEIVISTIQVLKKELE